MADPSDDAGLLGTPGNKGVEPASSGERSQPVSPSQGDLRRAAFERAQARARTSSGPVLPGGSDISASLARLSQISLNHIAALASGRIGPIKIAAFPLLVLPKPYYDEDELERIKRESGAIRIPKSSEFDPALRQEADIEVWWTPITRASKWGALFLLVVRGPRPGSNCKQFDIIQIKRGKQTVDGHDVPVAPCVDGPQSDTDPTYQDAGTLYAGNGRDKKEIGISMNDVPGLARKPDFKRADAREYVLTQEFKTWLICRDELPIRVYGFWRWRVVSRAWLDPKTGEVNMEVREPLDPTTEDGKKQVPTWESSQPDDDFRSALNDPKHPEWLQFLPR